MTVTKLNTGKAKLDDMLCMGKTAGDHTGLGYQTMSGSCQDSGKTRTFVNGGLLKNELETKKVREVPKGPRKRTSCTYCGMIGHNVNQCLKIGWDVIQSKPVAWPNEEIKKKIKVRAVWVKKDVFS